MESNTADRYRVTSEVDNYMKLDSKRGNLEESAYNKLSFPEVDNYMKLGSKRGNVEESVYNKLSFPEVDSYMKLGSIRHNFEESAYNKLSFPEGSRRSASTVHFAGISDTTLTLKIGSASIGSASTVNGGAACVLAVQCQVDNYMTLGSIRPNLEESTYNNLSCPEESKNNGHQRRICLIVLVVSVVLAVVVTAVCLGLLLSKNTDINECQCNPCLNGATCNSLVNNYTCACAPGYTGTTCEQDINECQSIPCQNRATCKDLVNGYKCTCAPGYTGIACGQDINECQSTPCLNRATCKDLVNGYKCTCAPGYTGTACGQDINECLSSPCQNRATCKDLVNGYACACAPGYTGTKCEQDINECQSDPCRNGATCSNLFNRYTCTCAPGYTGTTCGTDINECQSNPCLNGATCNNLVNGYTCTCAPGYIGTRCQLAYTGPSELILRNDVEGSNSYFFNRSWAEYKQEFGSPTSRYWIGLDRLHQVSQESCKVHFDLQILNGSSYFAQYSIFSVGGPSFNYTLTIAGYSGDLSDAMAYHNGCQFTTYDVTNDGYRGSSEANCARRGGGGFWFQACATAHITRSPANSIFYWADSPARAYYFLSSVEVRLLC